MNTQRLSTTVQERLDAAIEHDPASMAAFDAWYRFKGQFDNGGALAHLGLHHEMDGGWVDCIEAVKRAAWLDGFACGRDPMLLVLAGGEGER